MPHTTTTLHNVSPADVTAAAVYSPGLPTVTIRVGELSVFITDLAVLDAFHEAVTRAYELLVENSVSA